MAITKFSNSTLKTPNRYNDFLAGNTAYDPGGYWPIASAAGTGSSGTITLSSIPGTYKHLQVRYSVRCDGVSTSNAQLRLGLNGDTANNYTYHYLQGDGSTVSALGETAQGFATQYQASPGGGTTASTMGVGIIDILDYSSSSKNKTIRVFSGVDFNNAYTGYATSSSNLWLSTAAITQMTFTLSFGNFTTASSIELYGIKEF